MGGSHASVPRSNHANNYCNHSGNIPERRGKDREGQPTLRQEGIPESKLEPFGPTLNRTEEEGRPGRLQGPLHLPSATDVNAAVPLQGSRHKEVCVPDKKWLARCRAEDRY